jgi:hypothetical protein
MQTNTRRTARRIGVLLVILTACVFGLVQPPASAVEPVLAEIPQRWKPPQERGGTIDFALGVQADAWLHHGVLGDPSFDSFVHARNNPIVRGKPPLVWPVNGFLFEDPQSGNWYAYVGHYNFGYDVGPGKPTTHCRVHRSKDRGATWEEIGPIFDDPDFRFAGFTSTANVAPDVSVVYADRRYHLSYDWCTDVSRWTDMRHPPEGHDNGCAYAWSERPEGPFHRAARPIMTTRELPKRFAMSDKYGRIYGTSIVRRQGDWLALILCDAGQYFSWGMLATTAVDPNGPWSDPVLVCSVEREDFYPSTAEQFPAMTYDGYVYLPTTSVALNRNFQAIFRAKTEEAQRPDAWHLYQNGTAWHSDPVPNEALGIWGQTFSGFVDRDGQFNVLSPSRERGVDLGTINLASRPWAQPIRERGFVHSGHQGPSLALLRCVWKQFELKTDFALQGGMARIMWAYQAPLAPDRHAADATIHPLSLTRHQGLELSADAWRIVSIDAGGKSSIAANGPLQAGTQRAVEMKLREDGSALVKIDGNVCYEGALPVAVGSIGLLVEPFTNLRVSQFELTGPFEPAVVPWLYLEALTGAGVDMNDWDVVQSPVYRFGVGAVRKTPGGWAKWNFRGRAFQLWSPRGPELGRCDALLDGKKLVELDLHSDSAQPSEMLLKCDDAGDGYHTVILRSTAGRLSVDSLDVLN